MMKRKALAVVLLLFAIDSSRAESELSVGVGIGALHSGVGVNVGMRSENSFGYLAAGCIAFSYTDNQGWSVPCGVGAGWIWTDVLAKANNRHGLGIYVGPVGTTTVSTYDIKARYGAGLTYVYFFGDVVARGWNLGVTPTVGKQYGDYRAGLMINAGYQF